MPRESIAQAYLNRRMAALAGLGFASGFPALLIKDTLQAWLTRSGVDIKTIGLFSLVAIPFAFKFLWSPFMDRFVPPFLGQRRGWLAITQILLIAALGAMAAAGTASLTLLSAAALAVAFFSASQDIVADAYRTDVLPAAELGSGAAIFVTGYRVALIAAGSGVLALGPVIGWRAAYGLAAGAMALGLLATFLAPEPPGRVAPPATLVDAVYEPFLAFFGGRAARAILVLAFILLFKLPDVLANGMTMPFLLKEMKFTEEQVAFARQLVGLALTIAGALAGGGVVARLGVMRSLWVFGVLQAVSNAGYLLLAVVGAHYVLMLGVVGVEHFAAGLVTAGFVAYLMSQCSRRYSATQYALLTSFMALGGTIILAPTGYLIAHAGYAWFFIISILAAIPGMSMLPFLPGPMPEHEAPADSTTI